MPSTVSTGRVERELEKFGLLLESDPNLPSVTRIVTGRKIKGSWWGDPQGRAIWRVLGEFNSRPHVLQMKLISGKVTYVAKRLWPSVLAVVRSGESWQTRSLGRTGKDLYRLVQEVGEVDTIEARRAFGPAVVGEARKLERGLLVHSEQFHSESGFHAKKLRSWDRWEEMKQFHEATPGSAVAKETIADLVRGMNERYDGKGKLPWEV